MIISPANRLEEVQEYYFSTKLRQIADMRAQGHKVLNLGIGSPDLAPAEDVIQTLIRSAEDPAHHAYQPYNGTPELRSALADWYRNTYGVLLDPVKEILPLLGSKEGIMHITLAFVNPGDEVLIPDPGYPTYAAVSKLAQAHIRTYNLTEEHDYQPQVEELDKLAHAKTKILWLNYPHMPTGTPANDLAMEAVLAWAKHRNILVVNDNPYSLVLNEGEPSSIMQYEDAKEVAIELNSLSKSHNMAGWRVGMLAGAADHIQTVLRVKSNMDSGMFRPIQDAAVTALHLGADWHAERNRIYEERRKKVWELFDALGCTYREKQTGMFVWASIPEGEATAEAMVERLLAEKHIFITPGMIFGNNGKRHVRISLCSPEAVYDEALKRVQTSYVTT
ncbi:MAG: aminotransferase class I/II-fold pyridoxal phosphate-dependent enzyme [Flavobacteriales bacterium]|nr:aminotransferase class I/II-fold pyridoxal phosphate-dependent enzyme [Flavobacteriales bacterium]MCB9449432.1 aminotransferase class I/II-fold pyridoxal phosphate-dependent enzyme [Flavobacteriales bacterium]